jgi:hypothetical protein
MACGSALLPRGYFQDDSPRHRGLLPGCCALRARNHGLVGSSVALRIDLEANNVVWEREEGLAPFAVSQMIDYYMRKENIKREEATRKVMQRPQLPWKQLTYRIFHVYKGYEFVSHDPVTQALPKEPRNMPVYTVMFGWNSGNTLYSIFIPDNGTNGDAILSHYVADGGSSWVNLRFGKCRVLK